MEHHAVASPLRLAPDAGRAAHSARSLALCLAAFAAASMLVGDPHVLDYPVVRFLNGFANRSRILDSVVFSIDHFASFSGVVLLALAWGLFLGTDDRAERGRILAATLIAFPAGVLSRLSQTFLPTHARPFYDPGLGFMPSSVAGTPLNRLHSFPSDHATVFGAVALAICLARPRLAWIVVPWLVMIETARTYVGAHYPTDMIAGMALGAMAVILARSAWLAPARERMLGWQDRAPLAFYAVAFFVTYQIATLFEDVRTIVSVLKAAL